VSHVAAWRGEVNWNRWVWAISGRASGIPASSLLPANPDRGAPAARSESPGATAEPGLPTGFGAPGGMTARGRVHLTLPLGTWLGHSNAPGQVAGFGPVDATDARGLATALAAHPGTKWCLTLTDRDGHPVAHGCAHAGPSPGRRRARSDDRPRAGPTIRARDGTWTFTMTVLDGGGCDHPWQTPAYQPPAPLRHLVQVRHATCTVPGCRRPAA